MSAACLQALLREKPNNIPQLAVMPILIQSLKAFGIIGGVLAFFVTLSMLPEGI
jgi:hypothetical protein